MYVMNQHGHYFQIDVEKITVDKSLFSGCQFFDNEEALLQAVCDKTGCSLDEVEGATFFITDDTGQTMLFDDRGIKHKVDEPIAEFISTFVM